MPISTDEKRARELSAQVAALSRYGTPKPQAKKEGRPFKFKYDYQNLKPKETSVVYNNLPDTPAEIARKLNSMTGAIEATVIKDMPTVTSIIAEIRNKKMLQAKDIGGARIDMGDQRWHGGGLSSVSHDSTLTGQGTPASPLSAVGGGVSVETPVGLVNASNTVYTVTAAPKWVVADGVTYFDGAGYVYAALSITLTIPPSSYIRAIL